jgi:hypothetical protein
MSVAPRNSTKRLTLPIEKLQIQVISKTFRTLYFGIRGLTHNPGSQSLREALRVSRELKKVLMELEFSSVLEKAGFSIKNNLRGDIETIVTLSDAENKKLQFDVQIKRIDRAEDELLESDLYCYTAVATVELKIANLGESETLEEVAFQERTPVAQSHDCDMSVAVTTENFKGVLADLSAYLGCTTCEIQSDEPFKDAVNRATAAAEAAQTAQGPDQWKAVAVLWQQAITLMEAVSESDENYTTAQQKAVDYQPNLDYAKQNAGL